MEDHLLRTIEQAKVKLREQEQAVVETKKLINQLCAFAGSPPMYSDAELNVSKASGLGGIRSDTFYGKSAFTAVRQYLDMRAASSLGAASLNEIIEALKTGGFDFSTVSEDEDGAKRGVAISLAKNSGIFHKLPHGNWGLLAWYPEAKEKKQQKKDPAAPTGDKLEGQGEETKTA